jgi:hypothetical protein
MAKAGLQFTKKDDWGTPKEVVDFFGSFDYDPATTQERAELFGIPNYDTIDTDGLKTDWSQYENIWCNPPFTRKFEFLEKAVKSGSKVFFLLPIETLTTKRFRDIMRNELYTVWIPNGRIKFQDKNRHSSSPAFGSVVIELKTPSREVRHWDLHKK